MRKASLCLLIYLLAPFKCDTQVNPVAELAQCELAFSDLNNAAGALRMIRSGFVQTYEGKDFAAWSRVYRAKRKEVAEGLGKITPDGLSVLDARALSLMRDGLAADYPEEFAPSESLSGHCRDAQEKSLDSTKLHDALEACFSELGDHLQFEGAPIARLDAMQLLATLDDPARRKSAFLAMQSLWHALNNQNEPDSPYRRLVQAAAAEAAKHGSRIDAAARTLGVLSSDVEPWLEQILDTWRQSMPDRPVEPWDYSYVNGGADRALASAIPRDKLLPITQRYYRDLGADLQKLGVLYDLDPRPGKSPVAYMDFVSYGRMENGAWRPSVVRILASYSSGSLGFLNEFVHENGHAVHGMAVRNRPAFLELGDSLFLEAFADVTSWDNFDPAWQKKYLGRAASEADSLRSQYSSVMLDLAWALFEARMLRKPDSDPNAVWTEITSHYLHIVPHPEYSWWAEREQLVEPGYMVNYGLGAVVTADIRQRTREAIGPFNTGNPRWYPWLSENLLRSGREHETSELLRAFLGRPVSPQALLNDIAASTLRLAHRPPLPCPAGQPFKIKHISRTSPLSLLPPQPDFP